MDEKFKQLEDFQKDKQLRVDEKKIDENMGLNLVNQALEKSEENNNSLNLIDYMR